MSEYTPIPEKYQRISEKILKSFQVVFKFMEDKNIHTYDHVKDSIFGDIEKVLVHTATGSHAFDQEVLDDVEKGTETIMQMDEVKTALTIVFGEEFETYYDKEMGYLGNF